MSTASPWYLPAGVISGTEVIEPRMRKLIATPLVYVAWAAIVIVALVGTYPARAYVFAFTTLGLAWLTGAMALLGLAACVWSGALTRGGRVVILGSLIISAAAVGVALRVLSGFKWA
jgi:hypothetical protein